MAIFERTVFLRAHNYPAVARILELQMASLPPDTAQSFCSCNTVISFFQSQLQAIWNIYADNFLKCLLMTDTEWEKIPRSILFSDRSYRKETDLVGGKKGINILS